MTERVPAGTGIRLRRDALAILDPLLDQVLGTHASRAARAEHLGLSYSSFWRFLVAKDRTRYKADERTIANFLRPFPHLTFEDLFEIDGREAPDRVAA